MLRLRRNAATEPRIEIMPMIDVIFLLLTFFVFAMVLLRPINVMPMELETYASSEPAPAETTPAATISVRLDGNVFFNREPTPVAGLLRAIDVVRQENPNTTVYLALEDGEGTVDRGPILTAIWDQLKDAGLDIKFIGKAEDSPQRRRERGEHREENN